MGLFSVQSRDGGGDEVKRCWMLPGVTKRKAPMGSELVSLSLLYSPEGGSIFFQVLFIDDAQVFLRLNRKYGQRNSSMHAPLHHRLTFLQNVELPSKCNFFMSESMQLG